MRDLIIYRDMVTAIEKCHRTDEVKDIRDKALALEHYARQAQNIEAEKRAIEVRVRAERRAGQLLMQLRRAAGPGRGKKIIQGEESFSEYTGTKRGAKISDTQALRWQRLAAIPQGKFEKGLIDTQRKPSTSGLIADERNYGPQRLRVESIIRKRDPVPDRALWLWGQLKDFEREGILDIDPNVIFDEMLDTMKPDVQRIVPKLLKWLGRLKKDKR